MQLGIKLGVEFDFRFVVIGTSASFPESVDGLEGRNLFVSDAFLTALRSAFVWE